MLEGGKISYRQIVYLMIMTIIPTAVLLLPSTLYGEAKQDGGLSIILITPFGLIVTYIVTSLGLRFKQKTIVQYSEAILGKFLGKIIGLIICLYFIYINTIIVREFGDLTADIFFPDTPLLFFLIVIILVSTYAIGMGLEVIARVNEIVFPVFFIAVGVLVALAYGEMEFRNLQPVLAEGFMPILKATYPLTIWAGETIILGMLIPYLNIPKKAPRAGVIIVIVLVLAGFIIQTAIVAVFGAQTERLGYPLLSLARYVSVYDVVERLESIIMVIWVAGMFIKISVFYYCATLGLAQWLNIEDYRKLAVPIGISLVIGAFVPWESVVEVASHIKTKTPPISLAVQVGVPTLLLIVAILRGKGESNE